MIPIRINYGRGSLFQLDSAEYGVLGTNFLGIGEVPVDVSDRLVSLSISRGRQDLLEPVRAGQISITLRNEDGGLDPLNESSALFPGIEPSRSLTVDYGRYLIGSWSEQSGDWSSIAEGVTWNGVRVFSGVVDDIDLFFDVSGDALVRLGGVDAFSRLGLAEFPQDGVAFAAQPSGQRISDIIDSDPRYWSAGLDIDSGISTIASGTAVGNVVEYLNAVARSESGDLFVSRDGSLVFRDRHYRVGSSLNVDVLLADDGTGSPYESISRQTAAETLRTVAYGQFGDTSRERQSLLGLLRFGLRPLNVGQLLLQTADEVDQRLDYELRLRSEPNPTVRSATVSQERAADLSLLRADIGDPVEVVFSPPSVSSITETGVILNVRHDFTIGVGWRTTIGLRPEDQSTGFVVDAGRLGQNRLVY